MEIKNFCTIFLFLMQAMSNVCEDKLKQSLTNGKLVRSQSLDGVMAPHRHNTAAILS